MRRLRVEVVYALAAEHDAVSLELPEGTTAAEAVEASAILRRRRLAPGELKIGIHGKAVAGSTSLADGDRVEIYRPLRVEPKEARRQRASRRLPISRR